MTNPPRVIASKADEGYERLFKNLPRIGELDENNAKITLGNEWAQLEMAGTGGQVVAIKAHLKRPDGQALENYKVTDEGLIKAFLAIWKQTQDRRRDSAQS
jgi:hypothetical protein